MDTCYKKKAETFWAPPKQGETQTKKVKDKTYHFCSKCPRGRSTTKKGWWGNHLTKDYWDKPKNEQEAHVAQEQEQEQEQEQQSSDIANYTTHIGL